MIEVKGLTRYYQDFPAVVDVDFKIQSNSIVAFLGLNGAGKSTVLKMLSRILVPSEGQILIDNQDIWEDESKVESKFGYLPEEPALYREMRTSEFLRWCGKLRGMQNLELSKAVEEVITRCDLEGKQDVLIDALSHGYRKRVGIAQAIIHRPKLVILDEPFSGLDPIQMVHMRELLKSLKESCTLLISSHALSQISQVCDRILVLDKGRIVADGTEAEISKRSGYNYHFTFTQDSLEKTEEIEKVLEKLEVVSSFEFHSQAYSIFLSEDAPHLVLSALIKGGFEPRTAEPLVGELENVFANLVGKE